MLSYHTCPLATLGGKDTGGMNVYVRELTRHLGDLACTWMYSPVRRMSMSRMSSTIWVTATVWSISPPGRNLPAQKTICRAIFPNLPKESFNLPADKDIHYDLIHSHYWMSRSGSRVASNHLECADGANVPHPGIDEKPHRPHESEMEPPLRIESEKGRSLAERIVIATPAEKEQLISLRSR